MKKFVKVCEVAVKVAIVIFFAWLAVSFIDVAAHNNDAHPQYLPFNMFHIIEPFLGCSKV